MRVRVPVVEIDLVTLCNEARKRRAVPWEQMNTEGVTRRKQRPALQNVNPARARARTPGVNDA